MASAYGFQVRMVICFVWSIILVLTEHTMACRQREPRSDLSRRISLVEEMLILPSDGSCLTTESGTAQYGKILASHDDSKSRDIFNVTILCVYVISAKPPFQRVMLDFRWFDVSRRYIADPLCEHSHVTFYDGPDPMTSSRLLNATCGSQRPQLFTSSQSSLSMVIYASGNLSVVDFMAVYSSFSDEQFSNSTDESEPRLVCLSTNRCIPKALSCDRQGVSNCGDEDYSDQLNELTPSFCPVVYDIDWIPVVVIVACIAGLVVIFLLHWCCWRPGYIPWYLGRFRRTRCCELGGCCTTPSRHFCSGVCPCCNGYPCDKATGKRPVQSSGTKPPGYVNNNGLGREGHQAQLNPRSEGGRRDVNTPNNVFLVVDDGHGPIRSEGGKTKTASRRQQFLPVAHTNQASRNQPTIFPSEDNHPPPNVNEYRSEKPVTSKVLATTSPSGPVYGKSAESSSRGVKSSKLFTKKRVNPTFEPMRSAKWSPARSELQRDPLGAGPRGEFFHQGSRRLTPDEETQIDNHFPVYSDGGHVREGR
ncbi:uncharacterized protein [Asterias amurensis]|uniref:uncharacterized protein n=1 Tax=Asterias amurensis TaxID=7602 RepID=UPI003AB711AC